VNGLLLIQALRPDRLTAMARVFVEKSLGSTFLHGGEKELNLSGIVENEVIYLRNKSWKKVMVRTSFAEKKRKKKWKKKKKKSD
jgi:hypothetical protein